MKRSGKFYRKNESDVMKSLGLKPTKNSGSGWIEKEDGQNEYIICQLKSTDAQSIRIQQQDLHTLEYNGAVSHKLPVFVIQFLNNNEVWLLCKPEQISSVGQFIKEGIKPDIPDIDFGMNVLFKEEENLKKGENFKKIITSSVDARESYRNEKRKMYGKEKSSL